MELGSIQCWSRCTALRAVFHTLASYATRLFQQPQSDDGFTSPSAGSKGDADESVQDDDAAEDEDGYITRWGIAEDIEDIRHSLTFVLHNATKLCDDVRSQSIAERALEPTGRLRAVAVKLDKDIIKMRWEAAESYQDKEKLSSFLTSYETVLLPDIRAVRENFCAAAVATTLACRQAATKFQSELTGRANPDSFMQTIAASLDKNADDMESTLIAWRKRANL